MLRIALLGAGLRSSYLLPCMLAPEHCVQLVAMCDIQPDVRSRYETEYPGIATYADYRDMLAAAGYDAVLVMSPDYLHVEHATAALATGTAVYLEKPMAITPAGCDQILQAAQAHGDRLYLGHNMRFFPVINRMKQIIDSGRIGQVQAIWCRHFIDYGGDAYFKDWHSQRCYTTGLLLQKAVHDFDVMHYLADSRTTRVVAMGKLSVYNQVTDRRQPDQSGDAMPDPSNWPPLSQRGLSPQIDVEDHNMVLLQMASGVQASYTQCHYTPDGWRNYTVIGTAGRIENMGDFSNRKASACIRVYDQRHPGWHQGDDTITIDSLQGGHGGSDPLIAADFLQFVRTGVRRGAAPLHARDAVMVGYLATRSLREGNRPFDVPACEDEQPQTADLPLRTSV